MDKNHIRIIQGFEQASAMLHPFANFIGVYFKNLLENGFTRQEALTLVESYQIMLFNKAYELTEMEDMNDFGTMNPFEDNEEDDDNLED